MPVLATHFTKLDVCQWCLGSATHSSSSQQKITYSHWYLVKSSLLYCQFFHMYSTYIQRIEIALLSDPWCIQLILNTDSRHSNTDKYSLTICTYKLYRFNAVECFVCTFIRNTSYLLNGKMLNFCLMKMLRDVMLHFHCLHVYNGRACHLVFLTCCFWLHFNPKGGIQKGKSKQNKVQTCFEQFLCHLQIDFK